jgi:hypothetical protein
MTNAIDRRIARMEACFGVKHQPAKRRVVFLDDPEDAERRQRDNPGAIIVCWQTAQRPEQRL